MLGCVLWVIVFPGKICERHVIFIRTTSFSPPSYGSFNFSSTLSSLHFYKTTDRDPDLLSRISDRRGRLATILARSQARHDI